MVLSEREIIGLILWWAEGTKSRRDTRWKNAMTYPIELTNTNPRMIKLFLEFLRYDIRILNEKLRFQIQIHENDSKEELEKYWLRITEIPRSQMNKTIVRPIGNKIGKTKGTCKIRFVDKATYKKLEEMLEYLLSNYPGCGAVG